MNTLIFCFKILFYLLKLCHELANEYFYYIENTVTFLYLPGFSCRRISITGAQPQGLATGLSLSIILTTINVRY